MPPPVGWIHERVTPPASSSVNATRCPSGENRAVSSIMPRAPKVSRALVPPPRSTRQRSELFELASNRLTIAWRPSAETAGLAMNASSPTATGRASPGSRRSSWRSRPRRALVDQRLGPRRERSHISTGVPVDALRDRNGLSHDSELVRVEPLRDEIAVTNRQQPSVHERHARRVVQDLAIEFPVDRSGPERPHGDGRIRGGGTVEKVLAVRKERRIAVSVDARAFGLRHEDRHAAVLADLHDRRRDVRREDDDAEGAPGAAATVRRVADGLNRAGLGVHRLELAAGEESQGVPVRSPERVGRAFGACEPLHLAVREVANREARRLPGRLDGDSPAVG